MGLFESALQPFDKYSNIAILEEKVEINVTGLKVKNLLFDDVYDFLENIPEDKSAKIARQLQYLEAGLTAGLRIKTLKGKNKRAHRRSIQNGFLHTRRYYLRGRRLQETKQKDALSYHRESSRKLSKCPIVLTMKKVKLKIKHRFIPLEKFIEKKMKSERFRKAYFEELNRLQLAHEIITLRQRKRMTQKAVAQKAAMPQSVIARIESGTHSCSLSTLYRIAQVFGKTIGFKET